MFGLISAGTLAHADMGLAPVGPDGIYVSVEGGYLHQEGPDVIGHGTNATAASFANVLVSPDDGWFVGGMIGFASAQRYLPPLPFHRTEIYVTYSDASDSAASSAPPLISTSLKSVDGSAIGGGGLDGLSTISRRTWEGGLRFEGDSILSATSSVTWVLSPFIRFGDEDTVSKVGGCCTVQRNADVESRLYGALFALEPEITVAPGIALVGRVGAGLYGYNVRGSFTSFSNNSPDPFAAQLSGRDSGVGFRGQLGAALKFKPWQGARLETFVEADYFSDIGTAHTADNNPVVDATSLVATDDLWELKAGARLTIGLGNGN